MSDKNKKAQRNLTFDEMLASVVNPLSILQIATHAVTRLDALQMAISEILVESGITKPGEFAKKVNKIAKLNKEKLREDIKERVEKELETQPYPDLTQLPPGGTFGGTH